MEGVQSNSFALGRVSLIEPHPRTHPGGKQEIRAEAGRQKLIGLRAAEHSRYQERSAAERGQKGYEKQGEQLLHGREAIRPMA